MELRTCQNEKERLQAIELICRVFKPMMLEEYPLLLGALNRHHMWIAFDQSQVVASLNYYLTPYILGNIHLLVASIGAVCTDPNYRRHGLASQLLEKAREQMEKEKVDFVIISGNLPIYKRFGADNFSKVIDFSFTPHSTEMTLKNYQKEDLPKLYHWHQLAPYRYGRTMEEMETLIEATMTPDVTADHFVHLLIKDNKMVGYLVVEKDKKSGDTMIREQGGEPSDILEGIYALINHLGISKIHMPLMHNDPLVSDLMTKGITYKIGPLDSTLRIISFNQLISKIQPFLASKLGDKVHQLRIFQDNFGFHFIYQTTRFDTSSLRDAERILWDGPEETLRYQYNLIEPLKKCFPLPLVYPSGLNYQ